MAGSLAPLFYAEPWAAMRPVSALSRARHLFGSCRGASCDPSGVLGCRPRLGSSRKARCSAPRSAGAFQCVCRRAPTACCDGSSVPTSRALLTAPLSWPTSPTSRGVALIRSVAWWQPLSRHGCRFGCQAGATRCADACTLFTAVMDTADGAWRAAIGPNPTVAPTRLPV